MDVGFLTTCMATPHAHSLYFSPTGSQLVVVWAVSMRQERGFLTGAHEI